MEKKIDDEEIEIDLVKLFKALISKIWVIIISMVIGACLFFSVTFFFITPLYKSTVKMYVNNSSFSVGSASFSISSAELSAAKSLVETYIVILNTREVLTEVIDKAQLNYSYEELKKMITAEPINSTEVFEVEITDKDPYEAEKIANTIAEILPESISKIVDGSSMRIVDHAVVPSECFSPNYKTNTLLGAIIGFILSTTLIVIMTVMDTVIRSEEYLTTTYKNIPLLAVVPDIDAEYRQKDKYGRYGKYSK